MTGTEKSVCASLIDCKENPEGCKQKPYNGFLPPISLSLSHKLLASLETSALAVELLLWARGQIILKYFQSRQKRISKAVKGNQRSGTPGQCEHQVTLCRDGPTGCDRRDHGHRWAQPWPGRNQCRDGPRTPAPQVPPSARLSQHTTANP